MDSNNTNQTQETTLIIHGQYLKDLSFENPNSPESFAKTEDQNVDLAINIDSNEISDNVFEVVMSAHVKADFEGETNFIVEVEYAGIFTVTGEDVEKLLLVKCPEILFPYVRRIIFNATGDGGFIPLNLQPIDFTTLYNQKRAEALADQEGVNHQVN